MKLSLKRIAAVALTVCLLGVAAGTVYGGGRGPAPQPKPQPQPQPAQQKSASVPVIGSLSNGSTIGSLGRGSSIGSLSNGSSIGSLSNGSSIGSLVPQKSGVQPMIGTVEPSNPQPQPKPKKTEPDQKIPQNDPPSGIGTLEPFNPPPQSRPAEQPKPVEPGPQVVQETVRKQAPEQPKQAQAQDPIIIMPRSVRAGNASGGGSSNSKLPGYSGGDGSGPLIYNP